MIDSTASNCAQGYRVRNKHNNCPYSLLCAVCDMEDEATGRKGTDQQ